MNSLRYNRVSHEKEVVKTDGERHGSTMKLAQLISYNL
jgi:hypothetical protein